MQRLSNESLTLQLAVALAISSATISNTQGLLKLRSVVRMRCESQSVRKLKEVVGQFGKRRGEAEFGTGWIVASLRSGICVKLRRLKMRKSFVRELSDCILIGH